MNTQPDSMYDAGSRLRNLSQTLTYLERTVSDACALLVVFHYGHKTEGKHLLYFET
jgi:hypothetical protein